jgi:hypothetical protein
MIPPSSLRNFPYGEPPGRLIAKGLGPMLLFALMGGVLTFFGTQLWEVFDEASTQNAWTIITDWVRKHASLDRLRSDPGAIPIVVGATVVLILAIVYSTVIIGAVMSVVRGAVDLVAKRHSHGQVVGLRGEWVALASPGDTVVTALRVANPKRQENLKAVSLGDHVRIRSTLLQRYVLDIETTQQGRR